MKMELIEGSKMSAIRTQMPGNYPKENILQINVTVIAMGVKDMLEYSGKGCPMTCQSGAKGW